MPRRRYRSRGRDCHLSIQAAGELVASKLVILIGIGIIVLCLSLVMNAVAVAIVLGGVSTARAAQILTHINPWQKAGCIPELIKV